MELRFTRFRSPRIPAKWNLPVQWIRTSRSTRCRIAQSGSDIAPCNRVHVELAKRVREGIRDAGGIAFEFPIHPIPETLKRPTAALDRNLQYLSLVEVLYGTRSTASC